MPRARARAAVDAAAIQRLTDELDRIERGRVTRKPTLVTVNEPLAAWGRVLHDGDPAGAILDRLLRRPRRRAGATSRTAFRPVVSPGCRYLYFTSDRSRADEPSEAALSTRERNARLEGPGSGPGDSWRVPMSAVLEALGRTPRCATPCR